MRKCPECWGHGIRYRVNFKLELLTDICPDCSGSGFKFWKYKKCVTEESVLPVKEEDL